MPRFSILSEIRLSGCHPELQRVMREAIKYTDFSVVCGHRNEADQNRAYAEGFSKLRWPNSRHNTNPSEAVDVIPYPTGYKDANEFYHLAGVIESTAARLGVPLTWGGRWTSFVDLPHWELA